MRGACSVTITVLPMPLMTMYSHEMKQDNTIGKLGGCLVAKETPLYSWFRPPRPGVIMQRSQCPPSLQRLFTEPQATSVALPSGGRGGVNSPMAATAQSHQA
jgi:hypothetical protein